jgi:hypothetical protein
MMPTAYMSLMSQVPVAPSGPKRRLLSLPKSQVPRKPSKKVMAWQTSGLQLVKTSLKASPGVAWTLQGDAARLADQGTACGKTPDHSHAAD